MKAYIIFIFLLIICLSLDNHCISAQNMGNRVRANENYNNNTNTQPTKISPLSKAYILNDSTMRIQSDILMNVKADEYVAILSLTQIGATAKTCNETIEARIRPFIDALAKEGFRKEDIFTDFISLVPTYEYEIEKKIFSKNAVEMPSGFEIKKNVHIAYKKAEQVDKIMLIAADYEIYDIVKVDYIVKNLEVVYDTLRKKAISLIKNKLNDFVALNIQIKPEKLKYQTMAEDFKSTYPEERYGSYVAYSSAVPQKNVKTSVEIKKNITYYYDKANYNNYDVVINPVVIEPVIQFSYSLVMQYSWKK